MHVVIKRWKQRAAYVWWDRCWTLRHGMAAKQQGTNANQDQTILTNTNYGWHETNRAANQRVATSILVLSGGIGLFVWSFFP